VTLLQGGVATASGSIVHDGTTWLTAFGGSKVTFHRGTGTDAPFTFGQFPSPYPDAMVVAGENGSVDLAWTTSPTSQGALSFHYQRFLHASATGSQLTSLSADTPILPTENITAFQNVAFSTAGAGKRLAVWSDNRFGQEELYVRAIDLGSCP
jgi:hypothetical protein